MVIMIIEEKYISKKIKKDLLKKKFEKWNKETIELLIYVFNDKKYTKYYDINLHLLDEYIKWYSKNIDYVDKNEMYDFDKLINLYITIKANTYKNYNFDYSTMLSNDKIFKSTDEIKFYFTKETNTKKLDLPIDNAQYCPMFWLNNFFLVF